MDEFWYVLVCANCGNGLRDPLPMPFPSKEERTKWADGHMDATGHVILLMNQPRTGHNDASDTTQRPEERRHDTTT